MLQVARTPEEAALFMDRRPCRQCGRVGRFSRRQDLREIGGRLAAHYEGDCPGCGAKLAFDFYVPEHPEEPGRFSFGRRQPSELFDPASFLAIADEEARRVPADPGSLSEGEKQEALMHLRVAIAAIEATIAAIPDGQDSVPREANRQPGRKLYDAEPGRFERLRLSAYQRSLEGVAAAYRESLS